MKKIDIPKGTKAKLSKDFYETVSVCGHIDTAGGTYSCIISARTQKDLAMLLSRFLLDWDTARTKKTAIFQRR